MNKINYVTAAVIYCVVTMWLWFYTV